MLSPLWLQISQHYDLADARVLLALNHWLAAHPGLFGALMGLTGRGPDVLVVVAFFWLWFWREKQDRAAILAPVNLSAAPKNPWLRRKRNRRDMPVEHVTRLRSRAQTLLVIGPAAVAYIVARLMAQAWAVPRPFDGFLPIKAPLGVYEFVGAGDSFPSEQLAMLGAFAVGLWFWNRAAAGAWTLIALLYGAILVATGLQYPTDVVVGFGLGAVLGLPLLLLYVRQGRLHTIVSGLAGDFERTNWPYCYLMYFMLILFALEFAVHFEHILDSVNGGWVALIQRLGPQHIGA